MIPSLRFFTVTAVLLAIAGCAVDTGIRGFWTLRDTDFRRLKPGMTKADVVAIVGKPPAAVTYPNLREEVWDYSYLDTQIHMRAYVYFDTRGVFKHHVEAFDMDYYSGPDAPNN
ncbi:MAG: outer membrane protein assembly factor BamE [Betaproteobacteria bacterium]|nr:outer membrane protein assembly factor BamE [Betaproteobacteria bacterium]